MPRSNIFKKRKKNNKLFLVSFVIITFILVYISYINKINNGQLIVIKENKDKFYIIPKDKGGQKIENLNKKSLNLIAKETNEKTLSKPTDLYFSIQFYSDNNLGKVNDYLEKITNLDENIYDLEKFYILALFTDIGEEYFLLYQNFKTKKKAKDFCMNFLSKIDQCLIIDTTKF